MVIQYKCPQCGADLVYNSESGMLSCGSCGFEQPVSEYTRPQGESNSSHSTQESQGIQEYHCKNCGAVIFTDKDTTATTCSFCGAGVILSDRLSGDLAPSLVIPFSISKEKAMAAFKKWCRNGILTPKGFMTADRIKNITGIYVPFWLYDVEGIAEANATATKVRTYTKGDYIYTETSYFNVMRKIRSSFLKVPADASSKMNDTMMDLLEPYHYQDLKEFQMPYLAGYIAERYNYTAQEMYPRMERRVSSYLEQQLRESISGYSSVTYNVKQLNPHMVQAHYALFPVWMVVYDYKQSEHTFAMNGQTGKVVGNPPLSRGKIATWFVGVSGGLFLLLRLITFFLGGGAL